MKIEWTATRDISFEVIQNSVITHGSEVDVVDGIGTLWLSISGPKCSQPHSGTSQYHSPQEIFNAVASCMFPAEDSSLDGWRSMAPLFSKYSKEYVAAANGNKDSLLNGRLEVSGRTLWEWADSMKLSSGINSPMTAASLHNENCRLESRYKDWLRNEIPLGDALIVTQNGYVGVIHPEVKSGDRICLLKAFQNIVVLRPWNDGYKIVGYAHTDGMMHGELDHRLDEEDLQIFCIY